MLPLVSLGTFRRSLRLAKLEHHGRQAGRDAPLRFLIHRIVGVISDDPNGGGGLSWIGGEDDAPVAVSDDDLPPAGEITSQWLARFSAHVL